MAHLRNYVNIADCEVVALSELRPELAKKVAQRYGVANVYANHRDMLAAEKLDGVIASQRFEAHATLLPDIYPKVKHLFTEKPLAVSVAAAEGLAKAAASARCTHMVGYHKRSDPATVYAKTLIDEWKSTGQYGRLKYVRILMPAGDWVANGAFGLIQSDEKIPPLGMEPPDPAMTEAVYKQYVEFVNYYIHQVNLMRHLLGEPYKLSFAEKSGVLLAVESRGGVAGVIEMSPYTNTLDWEESALVAFEKAYVKLHLPAPLASNRPGRVEVMTDPGQGAMPVHATPTLPWVHAMRQQAENFVKVCQGKIAPPCEAAEAAEDLKIATDYVRARFG
jgi:predicted dehydrogenase